MHNKPPRFPRLGRLAVAVAIFALLLVAAGAGLYVYFSHPLPQGQTGAAADALARRIEDAVHLDRYRALKAVSFRFGSNRRHFRDLAGHRAEVQFDGYRVLLNLRNGNGRAFRDGVALDGEAAQNATRLAYEYHTNDYFWLNPFATLFAPGTIRQKISDRELLITFTSGGVTPGDSYLIETDHAGLPTLIKMWVRVLPLKGLAFSFEDWKELGGAYFATNHEALVGKVQLHDIKTYLDLPAEDRFREL